MSSNASRQDSSKTRSFFKGITTLRSAKTRVFAFLTLLILTAVFSASALTANNDQTQAQQSGSFTARVLSFFGFNSEEPAKGDMSAVPSATPPEGEIQLPVQDGNPGVVEIFPVGEDELTRPEVAGTCATPPTGMNSWYRFENNLNDNDPTPATTTGTAVVGGPTFLPGQVGTGAFFNGTTQAVGITAAEHDITGDLSLDAWVNPNALTAGTFKWVIAEYTGANAGSPYFLGLANTGAAYQLAAGVCQTGGGCPQTGAGGAIPIGVWTHIGLSFNQASGVVTFYINGAAVGTANGVPTQALVNPATPAFIGAGNQGGTASEFFPGSIDEVEIFAATVPAAGVGSFNDIFTSGTFGKCTTTFTITGPATIPEEGGPALYTVTRSGDQTTASSVTYAAAPSGATPATGSAASCGVTGVDFQTVTGNLLFAANSPNTQTISVPICPDAIAEPSETFSVTLTQPLGTTGGVAAPSSVETAIVDNDNTVGVNVPVNTAGVSTVVEGNAGSGNAAGNPVSVTFTRTNTLNPNTVAFSIANTPAPGAAAPLATGLSVVAPATGACGTSANNNGVSDYYLTAGAGATSITFDPALCTGTIVFNGASPTAILTVTTNPDTVVETNENLTVTVAAAPTTANPYTIGAGTAGGTTAGSAQITITNDDNPTVQITAASNPATSVENVGTAMVYTFTRDSAVLGDLTINFNTAGSTARCQSGGTLTDPTDYVLSANPGGNAVVSFPATAGGNNCSGTVQFTNGATSVTVRVVPNADTLVEANETVLLVIQSPTGGGQQYNQAGNQTGTGTILNDDTDVFLLSAVAGSAIAEDAATGTVMTYTFRRRTTQDLLLNQQDANFDTAGSTATCSTNTAAVQDYTVGGTQTFTTNAGEPCAGSVRFQAIGVGGGAIATQDVQVTVDPTQDAVPENNESVVFNVRTGTGYNVGDNSTGTATNTNATGIITNDDFSVTVQVAPQAVPEGSTAPPNAATLVYTFTRTGETTDAICANFSASGSANAVTVGAVAADYTFSFGTAATAPCPANLFVPSAGTSSGNISIPGGLGAGNPAPPAVQTNQNTFIVSPTDDDTVEPNEEVQVRVENYSGVGQAYTAGTSLATGTITNDDSQRVSVTGGGPGREGNTGTNTTSAAQPITFTFNRTGGDNSLPLVVNYTIAGTGAFPATAGDLSNPPANYGNGNNNAVTIPATQSSTTLTITPNADNVIEPDEQFIVTVVGTADYTVDSPSSQTGTILNDDNTVSCAISADVNEGTGTGNGGVITVTCTRTTDGAIAGQSLAVVFTRSTGDYTSPTSPIVFAAAVGAVNGTPSVTTSSVTFTANPDATVEPNEQVSFTIANQLVGTNGVYVPGGSQTLTSTFLNDDNTVSVAILAVAADGTTAVLAPNATSVFENSTNLLRYTFTRTALGAEIPLSLAVNFRVNGGTVVSAFACASATNCVGVGSTASDFDLRGTAVVGGTGSNLTTWNPVSAYSQEGTVTFPAGAGNTGTQTVVIFVDPIEDTFVENGGANETVTVEVIAGARYVAGSSATGNIVNDDTSFSVAFFAGSGGAANEGNDNVTDPHGVVPETGAGPAPDAITGLTPHGSHATFTVTRAGDLSTIQRIDISTIPTGTNGAGTATSGPPNSSCGTEGVDYITDGKTLEFAVNQTTRTFYVAVCGDLTFENNETINVQLTNPQPLPPAPFSVTVPIGTATWTIINDDGATGPWVRPTNVTVTEGGTANFQVCLFTTRSGSTLTTAGSAIFFDYTTLTGTALDPADYIGSTTNPADPSDDRVIPANTSCSGNIPVPTVDDNLFEGDETFFIQISNINPGVGNVNPITPPIGTNAYPAGGSIPAVLATENSNPGRGRGIILENEVPNTFTISNVSQAEGNGGDNATTFNHLLVRSGEAAIPQEVCWITQDGNRALPSPFGPNNAIGGPSATGLFDYTSITTANCFTFTPGGPTTVNVPVVVNGDNFFEADDTYTVRLTTINGQPGGAAFVSNASHANNPNYAGLGIGTIQNDDATPIVGLTTRPTIIETNAGEFNYPVTFSISTPTAVATSVTYTVTSPGAPVPTGTAGATLGPLTQPSPTPAGYVACTGTIDLYVPLTTSPYSATLNTNAGNGLPGLNVETVINLRGCGDLRPELGETFTVTITSATNAIVAAITTGATACPLSDERCGAKTFVITDNDALGAFNFTDANGLGNGDVSLAEGSTVGGLTNFTFFARYVGVPAEFPITVTLETVDGTGQDGNPVGEDNDYIARNNLTGNPCVVTFPANSNAAQPCTVQVRHDSVQEIDETFTLQMTSISSPGGIAANPPGTDLIAQGNILNDDGSRVFSVTALSQTEGTLSPYVSTAPGATKAFVHRIEAQGSSNLISTVNFTVQGFLLDSGNGLTARVGANCDNADTSVTGTDVISQTGVATFQPTGSGTGAGFDFVDVVVQVCSDTRVEGNDLYRVVITSGTNASISTGSGNGLGTIVNDDFVTYSLVTSTININEGNNPGDGSTSNATITLVKTGVSNAASTVTYTLTNVTATGAANCSLTPTNGNPDYRSGILPVVGYAADETGSRLIQVPICGDTFAENDESFTVTITPSDGAPLVATVNIINDDGTPAAAGIEGDVVDAAGGPAGGDGVLANDVAVTRQFALGNLTPVTSPNQFQRGDTSPRTTFGDGRIDSSDVTQTRRYQVGLDPVTPTGGPTVPVVIPAPNEMSGLLSPDLTRIIRAVNVGTQAGAVVTVLFELDSQGDEASTSFTVNFNPAILSNPVVVLGTGVPAGSNLGTNVNQVATGRIGILVDSTNTYAAGTRQIIRISFNVAANAPNGLTPVSFGSTPTVQSVSSAAGILLATAYETGNVSIGPPTAAGVTVSGRVTTPSGQGLRNATVFITDSEGVRRTAVTSSFGVYTFEDVEAGASYVMGVSSKRYRFGSRVVNVSDNLADVNFVGQE